MSKDVKHTVLPSGRTVKIRRGKGRDLMRAHRAAAGNPEPLAVSFALLAELAEIDGKPIVYEDILEMDLEDVLALQDEVLGGGNDGEKKASARSRRLRPSTSRASDNRRAHRIRILLLRAKSDGSPGPRILD
jgi:hypothetical protein